MRYFFPSNKSVDGLEYDKKKTGIKVGTASLLNYRRNTGNAETQKWFESRINII